MKSSYGNNCPIQNNPTDSIGKIAMQIGKRLKATKEQRGKNENSEFLLTYIFIFRYARYFGAM